MSYKIAKKKLHSFANTQRKETNLRFFKTGKGEYGEGDVFIGVSMPDLRSVVKEFWLLSFVDTIKFVQSPIHEERLTGLLILVEKYKHAQSIKERNKIFNCYVKNFKFINNWDLVDSSAYHITGPHLATQKKDLLTKWARSPNLWVRRISILSTYHYIKNNQTEETLRLAKILLHDTHDLIHKAVGWMLREAAKKDLEKIEEFLNQHAHNMPRTMLRYAIEKFSERKRKHYLNLKNIKSATH